ncbi:LysR family transcriptional regulator [Oryzifoliimicrobium ureilyticus]|uniref:LysR family transcriptional regulator n=1 Tax=Oryzifoliimicrobium ureilyticus TaxID=3113724 RepID=UPI0030767F8C
MDELDLNLLLALDVLLAESSVTRAAHRLNLSASAMSRTLARLRAATGDPLLVRAGRSLVLTRYGEEIRPRVHEVAADARALLRPAKVKLDLAKLERTFLIRVSEAFLEMLAAPLVATISKAAPQLRLGFVLKPERDADPLREGEADLEIGVLGTPAPELRTRLLFRDRMMGVARKDHPLFGKRAANETVTVQAYAACDHIVASKRGIFVDAIDAALDLRQLKRAVRVVVPGYPDAMRIAAASDLVAAVPRSCLGRAVEGEDGKARRLAAQGLRSFILPVELPDILISAIWHPRVDADPAHRWLRDIVTDVCRAAYPL